MKPPTRKPRQRLNEKLGDYNARLREWMKENNASTYAIQHARRGGELSEEETDRNLEAIRARIADEPDLPIHLAPSYKPHKHAEDERLEDYEAGDTPQAAPLELGHLQSQLAALTARVIELERLVASTVAYRSLKPSAKAKVDRIDPSVGAAFKDRRSLLALTIYDHVANMGGKKKAAANFPKDLRDEIVDYSGETPDKVCRVIPYTALLHRLAAKKDFRPSLDERSSQENARLAIEKSGLIVTTMHEAGIRSGSALLVVMDRVEAEARGVVRKGRDVEKFAGINIKPPDYTVPAPETRVVIVDESEKIEDDAAPSSYVPTPKKGNPRFAEWEEENDTSTVPDEVLTDTTDVVDEPTTTPTVDDEGGVDDEPWEEEDEQPDEDFALFREPEEPQKSSKAVDLFG